jgi:4-hydroxy-3-polyprenylbenzoate decarboxylase
MNVTAITRRRNPVFLAFLSQFPPSESSILRGVAHEHNIKNYLSETHGIPGILQVALHESTGSWGLCVVQVDRQKCTEPGRILEVLEQMPKMLSKTMVVVDDDIPPRDANAVNWAIAFRTQPHRDMRIVPVTQLSLDPSVVPPDERGAAQFEKLEASALMIDATRKWVYPPLSLPKREYMERALERWNALGLGPLQLNAPWYGYSLGYWSPEVEEEAALAVEGRWAEVGERNAQQRSRPQQLAGSREGA